MSVHPTIGAPAPLAAIANTPATVLNPADQKTQKVSKGFFSSLANFIVKLLVTVTFPVSIPLLFLISKIHNALSFSKPSVTTTDLPLNERDSKLPINNAKTAPAPLAIKAAPAPLAIKAAPAPLAIEAAPAPVAEEVGTNSLMSSLKILAVSVGAALVINNVFSAFMTSSPLVSNFPNSTLFTSPHHFGQTSFN